eukprot:CAMPEP_0116838610 /NCGR_PEP_ID=MMETSP0418-20121206/9309_1 /TAXON_ID=1158023 /ORGANISM="Astrosyne radiata, Strain 13vi08-1A" /LENGTH=466 /DNA_ID=CAMNT_0004468633 /DNA_START=158 /DNA_END=1558 /DNA_ORIENTATION=-
MSEALYTCTGHQEPGVDLSHYGLGIEKYTHFTSPIRRYADVVVHKQLVAALEKQSRKPELLPPPGFAPRDVLGSVPDSSAISILHGEGLKSSEGVDADEDEGDEMVDALIDGTTEKMFGDSEPKESTAPAPAHTTEAGDVALRPYPSGEVARICDGLNRQNRMAKLSSMECQRLFLSLYFRRSVEETKAVVTDLRSNGLFAYVPKFDLRAPVYVSDKNGNVQVDPSLLGLPPTAGLEATVGFSSSTNCRRFPSGKCSLVETADGVVLDVAVAETTRKLRFRVLDVVSVQITCEFSDTKARIPPPRLHLISEASRRGVQGSRGSTSTTAVTSSMIGNQESRQTVGAKHPQSPQDDELSVYQLIHRIEIRPVLHNVPTRSRSGTKSNKSIVPGRRAFGEFVNPDTRTAMQEAAVMAASESASQRRAAVQASQAKRAEYDSSRTIERMVTQRTQKLAAGKRDARRAKAK